SVGKRRVTMRPKNWNGRAAMLWLMLTMMVGAGLAAPSSMARAQDYSGRWDRMRMSRFAFVLGYNRGYEDAYQNSYRTSRDVQRWGEGSEGWEDQMGSRTVFRDNFRRGFVQGFVDERRGRPRRYNQGDADRIRSSFDRGGPGAGVGYDRDLNRVAEQNGYRDGQRRGSFDARLGRRIDLDIISPFRIPLNGYRTQYGDRESYRQAYRDGFRRGYEDALQGR